MKPLIGIIMRANISRMGHGIEYAYDDIIYSVRKSGGLPVAIPNSHIDDYLTICHGFIFQGGDDICKNDLICLNKIRNKNIPILGICLGMQEMGYLGGGKLADKEGHYGNIMHEIEVIDGSLLSKILGVKNLFVNSRHKSVIVSPKIKVDAIANDGVIEAISDDNLTFFLGVQWHPENMYDEDINAKKIFDYFIKMCNDKACK